MRLTPPPGEHKHWQDTRAGLDQGEPRLGKIVEINDSNELYDCNFIIFDCSKLGSINVMGGELFNLESKLELNPKGGVLFVGLTEGMKNLLGLLNPNKQTILNFDSLDKAVEYISDS